MVVTDEGWPGGAIVRASPAPGSTWSRRGAAGPGAGVEPTWSIKVAGSDGSIVASPGETAAVAGGPPLSPCLVREAGSDQGGPGPRAVNGPSPAAAVVLGSPGEVSPCEGSAA